MDTNRSPLGATVRCRAGPRLSATTAAQKPAGSVSPPLSASHPGAAAARPPTTVTIAARPAAMKPVITRLIRLRIVLGTDASACWELTLQRGGQLTLQRAPFIQLSLQGGGALSLHPAGN